MAKTPTIEVGVDGEREAVVLLRSVRASNGQEFLAGWRVGFTPATCEQLVAQGWATRPGEQPVPAPLSSASLTPATGVGNAVANAVGYVGTPTVSTGDAPQPVEPDEPSQSKPTSSRRRK